MLPSGTLLQDRYSIIGPIGEGGMGAVYSALDKRLGNIVAVKETFYSTHEAIRSAFKKEARLLARLYHPALPTVLDLFGEGERLFLVMQFVAGENLAQMMVNRRRAGQSAAFPAEDVLPWAGQLLDALEYLHGQSAPVLHRDIKPENLKLRKINRRDQIVLLDFGLAKGDTSQTNPAVAAPSKSVVGVSHTYSPLEQHSGGSTDARSDLYSLGATLYHLLTGVKPPGAMDRAGRLAARLDDPLRPADEMNPDLSPALTAFLQKATALLPEQRFLSAVEMRRALHEACREPERRPRVYDPADDTLFAIRPNVVPAVAPAPAQNAPAGPTPAGPDAPVLNPFDLSAVDTQVVTQTEVLYVPPPRPEEARAPEPPPWGPLRRYAWRAAAGVAAIALVVAVNYAVSNPPAPPRPAAVPTGNMLAEPENTPAPEPQPQPDPVEPAPSAETTNPEDATGAPETSFAGVAEPAPSRDKTFKTRTTRPVVRQAAPHPNPTPPSARRAIEEARRQQALEAVRARAARVRRIYERQYESQSRKKGKKYSDGLNDVPPPPPGTRPKRSEP